MRMSLSVQMMGMGFVYQSATCVTSMMTVLVELMSRTVAQVSPFTRLTSGFIQFVCISSTSCWLNIL